MRGEPILEHSEEDAGGDQHAPDPEGGGLGRAVQAPGEIAQPGQAERADQGECPARYQQQGDHGIGKGR